METEGATEGGSKALPRLEVDLGELSGDSRWYLFNTLMVNFMSQAKKSRWYDLVGTAVFGTNNVS